MICQPSCVNGTAPQVGVFNGCKIKKAKGGIPRLFFLICDPTYVHPVTVAEGLSPWSSLANVQAAMCAGLLHFTGPILGQQPKGSLTKKRISSDKPEQVVGGSQTITFQDYNTGENLEEYAFYDFIMKNYELMSFGWVTCDDLLFMYDGDFAPEISPVTEATNNDSRFFDGVVTMQTEEIITPIKVEGLLDLLKSFNATTSCYYY